MGLQVVCEVAGWEEAVGRRKGVRRVEGVLFKAWCGYISRSWGVAWP